MPCFLTKRCATGRSRATETVRHGLWMLLLFHHVPPRSTTFHDGFHVLNVLTCEILTLKSNGCCESIDDYCLHALSLTLFHSFCLFHSCHHPQR